MDYMSIANSPIMWLACGIPVSMIVIQAIIFVKETLKACGKLGVTKTDIHHAVRGSFIASVGPSIVVAAGALSLLITMGGPIAWLRLSFIGAVQYELNAASLGAQAAGATLGTDSMTGIAFANGVWVMTLGAIGWLVMTVLFTKRFDKMTNLIAGSRKDLLPIITLSASLGCFANLTAGRIIALNKGTVAVFAGAAVMVLVTWASKKYQKKWLSDWSLTIAMFAGMLVPAFL